MVRPARRLARNAGALLLTLALLWAAGSAAAAEDDAPCRVSAEISPHTAWVGQQLLYRVRIVRREDVEEVEWVMQPAFSGFRAEWLPGRPEDTEMHYRGVRYLAREEHRALFPARAGTQRVSGASIRCRVPRRGPRPAETLIVGVPEATLQVQEPPQKGRPSDYSGIVGSIWVRTIVSPKTIHLGESVSVSVGVRGDANVWAAIPPIEGDSAIPGAEVFASVPSLDVVAGESLQARRFFRYEVVPLGEGLVTIPAVRIPYYDPGSGRYALAEAPAVGVTVLPRPPTPQPRARTSDGPDAKPSASSSADGFSWLASFAVAIVVLCLAGVAARRARSRGPWKRVDAALAAASTAADAGDPVAETRALSTALRAALGLAHPELDSSNVAGLRARPGDPELVEAASLLEALDWIRYAGELGHPDRDAIRRSIEVLRARFRSGRRGGPR